MTTENPATHQQKMRPFERENHRTNNMLCSADAQNSPIDRLSYDIIIYNLYLWQSIMIHDPLP